MNIKLIGQTYNNEVIAATAARLSRAKGSVSKVLETTSKKEKEDNISFISRVVGMGHTSIIDHVYFNFAIENVTPVIEQLLIESRYCSLTIKSRREANFSDKVYYIPEFLNENGEKIKNSKIKKIYTESMDMLFDTYQEFVDGGIKVEDARYILPYSFYSQILFGADATEIIRIINLFTNGEYSHITEAKKFGELLYEELVKHAPYIDTVLKNVKYKDESELLSLLKEDEISKKLVEEVEAINLEDFKNFDSLIFTNAVMRINQENYTEAKRIFKRRSGDTIYMKKFFTALLNDYNKIDLTAINLKFSFSISYANLTHITRHRGVKISIPSFVPNLNLKNKIIPDTIKENKEFLKKYKEVFEKNFSTYEELKKLGVREEDLIYFTLSCNCVNVRINFDGDTFRHVSSLRSCKKAQWEIRGIVNKMVEITEDNCEYYGKIVGANCATTGKCPEKSECCKNPYPRKEFSLSIRDLEKLKKDAENKKRKELALEARAELVKYVYKNNVAFVRTQSYDLMEAANANDALVQVIANNLELTKLSQEMKRKREEQNL